MFEPSFEPLIRSLAIGNIVFTPLSTRGRGFLNSDAFSAGRTEKAPIAFLYWSCVHRVKLGEICSIAFVHLETGWSTMIQHCLTGRRRR